MKKKILICLILICVLFLNGCGVRTKIKSWVNGESEAQADKIANTIAKAIEEKDADTIKKLMAKDALLDIDDIDSQIDYLFDQIEGHITNIECDGNEKRTNSSGGEGFCGQPTYKEIEGSYTFLVDDEKYKIRFVDNYQGTTDDNTGLYGIKIIRDEDFDNGLSFYYNCANYFGIDIVEIDDIKKVDERLIEEKINGYEDIVDSMLSNLQYNQESRDSFVCKVKKQDTEYVKKLLKEKIVDDDITFQDYGFDLNEVEMYLSAIIDIDLKESNHYMAKMIWIKDDDNQKTGMTYFAIMPKEKYDSGEKFPEGEGLFIIE